MIPVINGALSAQSVVNSSIWVIGWKKEMPFLMTRILQWVKTTEGLTDRRTLTEYTV